MMFPWILFCWRFLWRTGITLSLLGISACTLGPDYHKPGVQIPMAFKEGADWQRAQANPQGAIASDWWQMYQDNTLSSLVEQSLKANPSIVAAEAAWRIAQATVESYQAGLFPTLTAGMSATRSSSGSSGSSGVTRGSSGSNTASASGVHNVVSANATASWEPDLWGQIRREIEAGKKNAQATDAQLAGQRLSIAASVASDYFLLRQTDINIAVLKQQQELYQRILQMIQASLVQGTASRDDVLAAQDTLDAVMSSLASQQIAREQYEHAIAVLTGVPPAHFSLPAQQSYTFIAPAIPPVLPSQLLERRPDVVAAERQAAAANARIGVAEAAFFPNLNLTVQDGFENSTLANLFTLPNRVWTLGPELAATIFDGGARTAAVHAAQATYDENVALYRSAVLTAFQNVEDSLSAWRHYQQQVSTLTAIYQRNQQLFDNQQTALQAGTASQQDLLNQQLLLLQAQQNLSDAQATLTQSSVTLIKNLGGGWQSQKRHPDF